jgi:serine phosphatase RsbU (regulator of sigma subunit)
VSVAQRLLGLFQPGERTLRNVAAAALQRSLMPDQLPPIPGLTLAARYIPADGDLGGDWYDVFVLPNGSVGLVMGDVMGHGFASAVIMGRLRSSLRSYALEHDDPADVLRRLDRKIEHFEPGAMATILYGVMAPPYDVIRFSSAGHFPPAIAAPGCPAALAAIPPDLPMGVGAEHARRTTELALPPGAALCLYTDGLVEQRPRSSASAGTLDQQLARLAGDLSADEPEAVVQRIVAQLPDPDRPDDDVAVLVLRRSADQPAPVSRPTP